MVGGSYIFNQDALNKYEKYKSNTTIQGRNKLFNDATISNNISIGMAVGAFSIWSSSIINGFVKVNRLKKTSPDLLFGHYRKKFNKKKQSETSWIWDLDLRNEEDKMIDLAMESLDNELYDKANFIVEQVLQINPNNLEAINVAELINKKKTKEREDLEKIKNISLLLNANNAKTSIINAESISDYYTSNTKIEKEITSLKYKATSVLEQELTGVTNKNDVSIMENLISDLLYISPTNKLANTYKDVISKNGHFSTDYCNWINIYSKNGMSLYTRFKTSKTCVSSLVQFKISGLNSKNKGEFEVNLPTINCLNENDLNEITLKTDELSKNNIITKKVNAVAFYSQQDIYVYYTPKSLLINNQWNKGITLINDNNQVLKVHIKPSHCSDSFKNSKFYYTGKGFNTSTYSKVSWDIDIIDDNGDRATKSFNLDLSNLSQSSKYESLDFQFCSNSIVKLPYNIKVSKSTNLAYNQWSKGIPLYNNGSQSVYVYIKPRNCSNTHSTKFYYTGKGFSSNSSSVLVWDIDVVDCYGNKSTLTQYLDLKNLSHTGKYESFDFNFSCKRIIRLPYNIRIN